MQHIVPEEPLIRPRIIGYIYIEKSAGCTTRWVRSRSPNNYPISEPTTVRTTPTIDPTNDSTTELTTASTTTTVNTVASSGSCSCYSHHRIHCCGD